MTAGPVSAAPPGTLVCSDWAQRYTSDPAVDLKVELDDAAIEVTFDGAAMTGLTIPDPDGMFAPDAFDRTETVSGLTARPGPDSVAIRRISVTWSDTIILSSLESDTPRVFWQRMRDDAGTLRETLLVGTCSAS